MALYEVTLRYVFNSTDDEHIEHLAGHQLDMAVRAVVDSIVAESDLPPAVRVSVVRQTPANQLQLPV